MLDSAEDFLRKTIRQTLIFTVLVSIGLAMIVDRRGLPWSLFFAAVVVVMGLAFWFGMQRPRLESFRRAVDIDREVLFAGRFLLIKMHSGKPLVNALIEASQSYGVASRYFGEIVHDIELGTSLEDAIERAMTYSSSDSWRKILFQIHNALKLGIDVTQSLEAVLEDVAKTQLNQIERYGKKLPTLTLFYMVLAVVFPSLGMTIITILLSFTQIQLNLLVYGAIIFLLVVVNFIFITMFKGIRPKVNI